MKIILAPDSFKESLSAVEAARAMAAGARAATNGAATLLELPVADGGEGTVECLVAATGGRRLTTRVTGPLGEPVEAAWGLLGDGRTAVIEMAAASGLPLVPPELRNPMKTTTFGTGELFLAALERGVERILIGIGGSATVDGGVGLAQALGVRFLDAGGQDVGRGGAALGKIARIDAAELDPRIRRTEIFVASDVQNPLTGPTGAAAVFGPQKGATPEMVEQLDRGLANLAERIRRDLSRDIQTMPGAGAAGGLGAALVAFLGAKLGSGIAVVLEAVRFREHLAGVDLVLTGEGQFDGQSLHGKAVIGVARAARDAAVPCLVIAGRLGSGVLAGAGPETAEAIRREGIVAAYGLVCAGVTTSEAMARTEELVTARAREAVETFLRRPRR
jgi:glycerate kinase